MAAGEIVGVAGLVGAGRSRLLHAIFGAEKTDAGTVRVRTGDAVRDVRGMRQAIAAGMGLLPEDRRRQGLVLGNSIADNIALAIPADAVSGGWLRLRRIVEVAQAAVAPISDPRAGPASR